MREIKSTFGDHTKREKEGVRQRAVGRTRRQRHVDLIILETAVIQNRRAAEKYKRAG